MPINFYKGDLPDGLSFGDKAIAIDTERSASCRTAIACAVAQLSAGDGDAHVVQISAGQARRPT